MPQGMPGVAQQLNITADGPNLRGELRQAREAATAQLDSVLDIRDAAMLRLQLLKDELAPLIAATPEAGGQFDLALVPGDPPRLWLDLVSAVVMEPNPRTYRLILDGSEGRVLLLETADRGEMLAYLRFYIAHRIVARQRHSAVSPPIVRPVEGYSVTSLILAWTCGVALGGLGLLLVYKLL